MWRYLAESVLGSSHERAGTPCQDNCRATSYSLDGQLFLIVACSDGAGSAAHSDVGSKLACETAVEQVTQTLDSLQPGVFLNETIVLSWLSAVRSRLVAHAEGNQVDLRQLACTLLVAVMGPDQSAFLQIGDGAMVLLHADEADPALAPVFWPQNGEYANTTYFVTDQQADEFALCEVRASSPAGFAAFTDGMQMLALDYSNKSAHEPFFTPIFKLLKESGEPSDLIVPFRAFLNSPAVNSRTDDDKTLVIAVRATDRVE